MIQVSFRRVFSVVTVFALIAAVGGLAVMAGLWGGPEGQEAAELTPVEGNELKFEINTSDGMYMELEFIKDESGEVIKCTALGMGMEMEGVKIK